jgi:hypothetical protein
MVDGVVWERGVTGGEIKVRKRVYKVTEDRKGSCLWT